MLQVIGEIGGTSSRWAVLSNDGSCTTWPLKGERLPGFNPLSGDGAAYAHAVRSWFVERQPEALEAQAVHIYGAGCGSLMRKERMAQAIGAIWPSATTHVHSDLTGAAIGLCGDQAGLVLILGTGMNAGHYDGQRLHTPMPSLGYLLGDEGSGADIGRHLLQDAFYGRIPQHVQEALFGPQGPVLSTVLEQVHGAAHPAKELAAYTARLATQLHEPYVRELLQGRFHELAELLTRFFTPEQLRAVYATGSVAYGFRELLAECLLDRGMSIIAVEPDPLPGLVRHHQQQVV
jgi:N-acetylglucosamine kinase-like BadF-type ATPase